LTSYPMFKRLRDAAKDDADLFTVAIAGAEDVSFAGGQPERAEMQYVSGSMFDSLGLTPVLGRLLSARDDEKPAKSSTAVISADYWHRRFANDPNIVGRTFRHGDEVFEIVGVVSPPFTGTEPGTMVDVFVPITANPDIEQPLMYFMRILARVPDGQSPDRLAAKLQPTLHSFMQETLGGHRGLPQTLRDQLMARSLVIQPAPSGSSSLQKNNERPLFALCVLSVLVLLVACANVANLVTAQTAAREKELALRVSIGGGTRRLVQLVLMESAWIGMLAAALGAVFAWRAAPFVMRMINPPDNPVQLALPADWRVFGFLAATTLLVTLLFSLAPALRASKLDPASALKGGENPHATPRIMYALIAAQVAFCVAVLFSAGMFVKSFERLTRRPLGFSPERVLTIYVIPAEPQSAQTWDNMVQDVARQPGVESAAMAGWPLVDGSNVMAAFTVNGVRSSVRNYEMAPGWVKTMNVPVLEGRDFNSSDTAPGSAIVNQAFAEKNFPGDSPIGKSFTRLARDGSESPFTIVGVLGTTCYDDLRDCTKPVIFLPYREAAGLPPAMRFGVFVVKTESQNPAALAPALRAELARIAPSAQILHIWTQQEILDRQTIQERLLSTLAAFFAVVALLLAGIGLYGILNYSVVQRRREIGIRIAVGAQSRNIARSVIGAAFAMVVAGVFAGLLAGAFAVRPLQSIFYEVKSTDAAALALPAALILGAALLAAVPAVIRAVKIDPVILLRSE
jgi:predicted permease